MIKPRISSKEMPVTTQVAVSAMRVSMFRFVLKKLPTDPSMKRGSRAPRRTRLLQVVQRKKVLPPKLKQRLTDQECLHVGRVDVRPDGYCGAHVMQLVTYCLTRGQYLCSYWDILTAIEAQVPNTYDRLRYRRLDPHYLECAELALYAQSAQFNLAMVFQSDQTRRDDSRKKGRKRVRVYNLRVTYFDPAHGPDRWIVMLMSHDAHHYELLTRLDTDSRTEHRALWTDLELHSLSSALGADSSFPTTKMDAWFDMSVLNWETDLLYMERDEDSTEEE